MAANIYQAVKQAMQDLIAPQIESLKGDIGAVRAEVSGARAETQALRSEMQVSHAALAETLGTEIRRVDEKLSSEIHRVDEKLSSEIRRIDDKLTWALDLRERIVAIETRLGPGSTRS